MHTNIHNMKTKQETSFSMADYFFTACLSHFLTSFSVELEESRNSFASKNSDRDSGIEPRMSLDICCRRLWDPPVMSWRITWHVKEKEKVNLILKFNTETHTDIHQWRTLSGMLVNCRLHLTLSLSVHREVYVDFRVAHTKGRDREHDRSRD